MTAVLAEGHINDVTSDYSDSESSEEELPVWIKNEQRWISGVDSATTCEDLIIVLLQDEENRGRTIGKFDDYYITEKWREVEQPLENDKKILEIWQAWGKAQTEVKFTLRRISDSTRNKTRRRQKIDYYSYTIHPKKLFSKSSKNEELLRHVLAQGEVIKKQLKRLRYSETQIALLEEKTHKARINKHGSNYLLETYLNGLNDVVDKNSDSGVITEPDSGGERGVSSQDNKDGQEERLSTKSEEESKETSKENAELMEEIKLLDSISKLNKVLLKKEEILLRLHTTLKKYDRNKSSAVNLQQSLQQLRSETVKMSLEIQENEDSLEKSSKEIDTKRFLLSNLQKELHEIEEESRLLNLILQKKPNNELQIKNQNGFLNNICYAKELNTLV